MYSVIFQVVLCFLKSWFHASLIPLKQMLTCRYWHKHIAMCNTIKTSIYKWRVHPCFQEFSTMSAIFQLEVFMLVHLKKEWHSHHTTFHYSSSVECFCIWKWEKLNSWQPIYFFSQKEDHNVKMNQLYIYTDVGVRCLWSKIFRHRFLEIGSFCCCLLLINSVSSASFLEHQTSSDVIEVK